MSPIFPFSGGPNSLGDLVFEASFFVWIVVELFVTLRSARQRARTPPSAAADRGSVWVIFLAIWSSIGFTIAFASSSLWTLPHVFVWVGSALILMGVTIRGWAIWVLGRYFSFVVTVRSDHQIIESGPYKWIRHPAYTGALLSILGVPLGFLTLPGFLVTAALMIAAFLYRMRVEEQLLMGRFGAEYRSYTSRTWRLLPFIY